MDPRAQPGAAAYLPAKKLISGYTSLRLGAHRCGYHVMRTLTYRFIIIGSPSEYRRASVPSRDGSNTAYWMPWPSIAVCFADTRYLRHRLEP